MGASTAPEVVLGDAVTDHRVDLYALGCVAYWLLTGKMVFEGENAIQAMVHHAHTPPPRPSLRVEWPIPAPLEDLLMECLENPTRRPPSGDGEHSAQRRPADIGLDGRASGALVGDAPLWRMFSCRKRAASCASAPGCGPGASGAAGSLGWPPAAYGWSPGANAHRALATFDSLPYRSALPQSPR